MFVFAEENIVTFNDGEMSATAVLPPSMVEPVGLWAGAYDRYRERLQPAALTDQIRADGVHVDRAFGTDVRAAGEAEADVAKRWAVVLTPPPSIPTERHAEWRGRWHGLGEGEKVQRALAADAEELAALIDGGRSLVQMSDDAWSIVSERAAAVFHVERTGMQARYAMKPSVERLIVHGANLAAAEAAAQEALQRLRDDQEAIEAREMALQSTLALIAAVTRRDPATVLAAALAA